MHLRLNSVQRMDVPVSVAVALGRTSADPGCLRASHRNGRGLIPVQVMWDLLWAK
jgi:hypothetical protein